MANRKATRTKNTTIRVTREQLAALIGVHPDTVADYTRDGMPVVSQGRGRGQKSVYDAVACLEWWRSKQGKAAKDAAQTRAYEAQAKLNELKLSRELGQVVSREDSIAAARGLAKGVMAQIRALPRRMTQDGLIPREREAAVAALCRDVLTEIAGWGSVEAMETAVQLLEGASAA